MFFGDYFVREIMVDDFVEGFDYFEDGVVMIGVEVLGFDIGFVFMKVVEGDEVIFGKIEDVDVIVDGGIVVGVVVCMMKLIWFRMIEVWFGIYYY